MERVRRIAEERADRMSDTRQIFKDLFATVKQHDYQPSIDDAQAIRNCSKELNRLPVKHVVEGAIGGFLVGTIIKHRIGATLLGMYLAYETKAMTVQPAVDRCLLGMMSLPTPMGTEMIEIVRSRDANHPLLSQLPDRVDVPSRIATPGAIAERDQQAKSVALNAKQNPVAGDGLWDLSDPFDLCFQQSADVSMPGGPAKEMAKKSKAQERKQLRQELYKARQEARKQHQEGSLSDDI